MNTNFKYTFIYTDYLFQDKNVVETRISAVIADFIGPKQPDSLKIDKKELQITQK